MNSYLQMSTLIVEAVHYNLFLTCIITVRIFNNKNEKIIYLGINGDDGVSCDCGLGERVCRSFCQRQRQRRKGLQGVAGSSQGQIQLEPCTATEA